MKNKVCLSLLLSLFPLWAHAHVQWFVTPEEMKAVTLPFDAISAGLTLGVTLCIVLALLMTRYSRIFPWGDKLVGGIPVINRKIYVAYFMALINIFFLILLLQGGFLAPNLILPESLLTLGVVLQAAIVVASTFSISLAGIFLLLTAAMMLVVFPFSLSVNYIFEFVVVACFMLLNGAVVSQVDRRLFNSLGIDMEQAWRRSIWLLRVGIGMQLMVLAATEKLINPGLGLVFVEMYPFYNFFALMGLEQISHLHFVYFIGISEMVLGGLLVLGVANRLVMLALAAAFTTTAIIHGIHEIAGHLPIFAAAVILLLECHNAPETHPRRISGMAVAL